MCGEKTMRFIIASTVSGSPPHVRGKASDYKLCAWKVRITPACARKRSQGFAVRLSTRDHPRVCGEKRFRSAVRSSSTGSPPRMRGKAAMVAAFASLLRITPAYAGKRTKPAWNWLRARDHPRVCGEKKIAGKTHALASGSPPHVRGKGRISRFGFYHKGITPACAWKSYR